MSQLLKQPKRGRPPLEPRITELEKRVNEDYLDMVWAKQDIGKLKQFVEEFYATKYVEWQQRIAALEKAMWSITQKEWATGKPEYQSNFTTWPKPNQ